jgi:hypothetical protein
MTDLSGFLHDRISEDEVKARAELDARFAAEHRRVDHYAASAHPMAPLMLHAAAYRWKRHPDWRDEWFPDFDKYERRDGVIASEESA